MRHVYPPKPWRRQASCDILGWIMPAIAPIEDLRAAQRDGRSKFLIVTPDTLPACPKPWRRQAPYDLRSIGNGGASDGRMYANCGYRSALPKH